MFSDDVPRDIHAVGAQRWEVSQFESVLLPRGYSRGEVSRAGTGNIIISSGIRGSWFSLSTVWNNGVNVAGITPILR